MEKLKAATPVTWLWCLQGIGEVVWESQVGVEATLINVRLHSVNWHSPTSCRCIFGHGVGPHMLLFTSYVFFNSVHF